MWMGTEGARNRWSPRGLEHSPGAGGGRGHVNGEPGAGGGRGPEETPALALPSRALCVQPSTLEKTLTLQNLGSPGAQALVL